MMQSPLLSHCDCCGLQVSAQRTDSCPRCKYPIDVSKEEHFLASSIAALQRVEVNGGAAFAIPVLLKLYQSITPALPHLRRTALYGSDDLTVAELLHHQRARLEQLRQLGTVEVRSEEDTQPEIRGTLTLPMKPLLPSFAQAAIDGAKTIDMEPERLVSQLIVPTPAKKRPLPRTAQFVNTPAQPTGSAQSKAHNAVASTHVPIPKPRNTARADAFRSFFIGSPISLMVLLGAFLILMAMLTFVLSPTEPTHHPNPLFAFLMVLGTQIFFGAASIGTQRLSKFINVARIYTFVFVLLIPLLGIEGYLLLERQTLHVGLPVIIVVAALYAALAYGAFAIYQRFSPFGYLGMMALVAADLAMANLLHLGVEWYPAALMILALPALLAVPACNPTSSLAVLRNPVRICMLILVACVALMMPVIFYVLVPNHTLVASSLSLRFARLSASLLLLFWGVLFLRLTKLTSKAMPFVPYLFLIGALDLAHTLNFRAMGYALVFTGVAVLYHGMSRLAPRLLEPFGKLSLRLDQLALVLASGLPLMCALYVPFQLLNDPAPQSFPFFLVPLSWGLVGILSIATLLTISVILSRTRAARVEAHNRWPWLLLLSGILLNWTYGVLILLLHLDMSLSFLGLTLSLFVLTVLVRQRFGGAWANPLDVLAFSETLLILGVSATKPGSGSSSGILLLFFAALFYGVLLFQGRHRLLVLPFVFALAAVPLVRTELRLLVGLGLPLAAIVIRSFTRDQPFLAIAPLVKGRQQLAVGREWPLLLLGLICGVVVLLQDRATATGIFSGWVGLALPFGVEIVFFALVWYTAAILTSSKWFLLPTAAFAVAAILFSFSVPFWALVAITTAVALIGLAVSRVFGKAWAAPWYAVAFPGAVLTGLAGYAQGQAAATVWVLLGFAALAYIIGLVEDEGVVLWLLPAFSLWSVCWSLILGDYYRAPLVALLCTVFGVLIGLLRFISVPPDRSKLLQQLHRYAQPFYITAIAAAVLTGLGGMLNGSAQPLHQYNPFVLLAFAGISYSVLLYERRPKALWLATGFALWGMILLPTVHVLSLGIGVGIAGLIVRRIFKRGTISIEHVLPFYATALVAALLTGIHGVYDPSASTAGYGLLAFTAVSVVVMLVERRAEILLVAAGLAAWMIGLTPWDVAERMVVYSLLCVLIFASQFVWRAVRPLSHVQTSVVLPRALGLGGQMLVVLVLVVQTSVITKVPALQHVGAGAFGVLALLLVWLGYMQQRTSLRHWCNYGAGLLVTLIVTWELIAFGQTKLDLLLLTPASYLSIIAPFLMRDKALKDGERIGQLVAGIGAALLLVPTGIASIIGNPQDDLLSTLLLLGEALSLFFLGIATRVRFFILGGAGLVIVGTVRALFLPPSFIPIWIVLVISGGALLLGATILTLRNREERTTKVE